MSNNTYVPGTRPAKYSLHENMAAYDSLPKSIRLALQGCLLNWSAGSVKAGKRRHKLKAHEIVALIAEREAKLIASAANE